MRIFSRNFENSELIFLKEKDDEAEPEDSKFCDVG